MTYRKLEKRDRLQEKELNGASLKKLTEEEFTDMLQKRRDGERLVISRYRIRDLDLRDVDLKNIDFSCTRFERVLFDGACMDRDDVSRCFFVDCSMKNVRLTNADATDASFRYLDLSGSDFSGTNFYYAALEYANLENVTVSGTTRFFGDAVPKKGAFICWKVGAGNRVIQLLVPADAGRVCATSEAGRCEKAKVLSITNVERTENYTWASAMVDDEFIYRAGEMVYPDNGFGTYGWLDDSPGIHFFMDREMAVAFGTGKY